MLDRGRIVELGSHEELMKLDGQYSHLFTLQARGYDRGEKKPSIAGRRLGAE